MYRYRSIQIGVQMQEMKAVHRGCRRDVPVSGELKVSQAPVPARPHSQCARSLQRLSSSQLAHHELSKAKKD